MYHTFAHMQKTQLQLLYTMFKLKHAQLYMNTE